MNNNNKRFHYAIFAITLCVVVFLGFIKPDSPSQASFESVIESEFSDSSKDAFIEMDYSMASLEETSYVNPLGEEKSINPDKSTGFLIGYAEVESALSMAKLDIYGQLILDDSAQASLNLVVSRLPVNLSEIEMKNIQNLIKQAMPGTAGEQVAQVLGNYYHLKQAEKKWFEEGVVANSPDIALQQLNEMINMRREYLGENVANQLFSQQQNQSLSALKRASISQRSDLTESQKQDEVDFLEQDLLSQANDEEYIETTEVTRLNTEINTLRKNGGSETEVLAKRVEVVGEQAALQVQAMEEHQQDWKNRYEDYRQEKSYILNSAISEADKFEQIQQLLIEHYSSEELAGARAYDAQQNNSL
ncbi:MAG: lipase secretion chaperone [Bermanella sp.]